jgi:diacylglycerol kinase (ATP)
VALPGESLERLKLFLGISGLRVVVGGGDGTIVAVANYLKETCAVLGVEPPPISVIPLGTGNDLSRTLGWGCQY